MRIAGSILIIAAFTFFGVARARDLHCRARLVAALATSVELLRGEIVSRLTPLPDAARRLAESGPRETRSFYSYLCVGLESLGEREFSEIWNACVAGLVLAEQDKEILRDLGCSLGRYDALEQDAALSRCIEALGEAAERARCEAANGGRLCAGVSISAGALLAIVLY